MGFLLLGIDSLIACLAVGALVDGRSRLRLAALFGIADGVAFLIGAGLGWTLLSEGASEALEVGTLVALGLYLLVVAAGTRQVAAHWPVWALPLALVFDNLAFGVVGDHAGSVLQQAGEQALSSSLLALVGLLAAAALSPVLTRRAAPSRVAGGALLFAAGALVLIG
jgi:hypothetical protein